MLVGALRDGLTTSSDDVDERDIELCRGRVLAFYHRDIVSDGTLILSVCILTGADLIQEN